MVLRQSAPAPTPCADGMDRDACVLNGAITTGTHAQGGVAGCSCTDAGKNGGGYLLLLRSLRLPPLPAPMAGVVAQASSPAGPPRVPPRRSPSWDTLPLPVVLPLLSPPAPVTWVETPASSPAPSPKVQEHEGGGGGC